VSGSSGFPDADGVAAAVGVAVADTAADGTDCCTGGDWGYAVVPPPQPDSSNTRAAAAAAVMPLKAGMRLRPDDGAPARAGWVLLMFCCPP
jgi:hypothetical protein